MVASDTSWGDVTGDMSQVMGYINKVTWTADGRRGRAGPCGGGADHVLRNSRFGGKYLDLTPQVLPPAALPSQFHVPEMLDMEPGCIS